MYTNRGLLDLYRPAVGAAIADLVLTNLPLFMISVAILTLGEIASTSIAPTVIADLSPVNLRGLYQGISSAAWGLAFFTGPLAGGWIYEHLGSKVLWASCMVLGFVLALCYAALGVPAGRRMAQQSRTSSTN